MGETLSGLWADTVAQAPEQPAVIDAASGQVWSRAEVANAAARMGATLPPPAELRGRRVLLAARNQPEWLFCWLALQTAGAIPAALDADEPEAAQLIHARALGATWRWRGKELEPVESLTPVRRRDRADHCLLKLTSGSTGAARALAFTHAQMIADGRQVCATMGIGPADVNLAVIPFGHSYGLGNLVLPLVLQGTAIVVGSGPLPQMIAADVERWRPTVFPAVPTLLRLLTLADIPATALASLRLVISAGAALAPEVALAFADRFGRAVHGFYGSSETGGIAFDATGEATAAGRSVGALLRGVRLEFRRGGRFDVVGAAVMGAGRYSPPDRATLDVNGELVLRGRTGRMVKLAGRRLDLAEVEQALRALPGVQDAWACAHPHKLDTVAAVVVSARPAAELRAALAARIASWKIPGRMIVRPELPVTVRGKPDVRRLRALVQDEPASLTRSPQKS